MPCDHQGTFAQDNWASIPIFCIVDRGKLSELEIAMWSGRKDVAQNQTYDYTPADEILARYREIDTQFEDFVVRAPVSQKDFDKLGKDSAIHATQMGFCRHPYSVSPCEKHRDCANCGEHCIIKGIPDREERIRHSKPTEFGLALHLDGHPFGKIVPL
jgi:hypothetical protein